MIRPLMTSTSSTSSSGPAPRHLSQESSEFFLISFDYILSSNIIPYICRWRHAHSPLRKFCHVQKFLVWRHSGSGETWYLEKFWIWEIFDMKKFVMLRDVEKNWAQNFVCGEKMTNITCVQYLIFKYILSFFYHFF